eukprot:SAG11_NODE_4_length_33019_cov_28.098909_31_plen_120_part_00
MLDACEAAGNHSVLHRLEETQPGRAVLRRLVPHPNHCVVLMLVLPDHLYGPKWLLLDTSFENNYFHANLQTKAKDADEEGILPILTKFSVQVCVSFSFPNNLLAPDYPLFKMLLTEFTG